MALAPSQPASSVHEGAAPQKTYFGALALLTSLFFMWGFCTVLNDALVPHLKAVFEMNYVQTMLIQFVFFLGYAILSLPAAFLIEKRGYKQSIVIGLALMAIGCLIFVPAAALPSYGVFLTALFVLAGGITILQVAANPYVAVLGPPKSASLRLNLVQAFNSFGTFVAPTFGAMLILSRSKTGTAEAGAVISQAERLADAQAVQGPYIGIAVVLLLIAGLIAIAKLPAVPTDSHAAEAQGKSLWTNKIFTLGVIGIFVYVGAEVTIGSFMSNYIASPHVMGYTTAEAANMLTFYWGGAMVGRFIGSGLMTKIRASSILMFNCLAAIVFIILSMLSSGHVAMWTMLLVGLCNSIMFPTIFTLSIQGLGQLTAKGSGYLIMAIFGGGILPLIQGYFADHVTGLTHSFWVPVVCYVFLLIFAWATIQRDRQAPPETVAPVEPV